MRAWFSETRLQRAADLLWGLVLLSMPVTTFRYLPRVFGQTQVKPLAFYPLSLLLIVLVLLVWRRRRLPLPANSAPLLAFLLIAALSSALGLLLAPIPLRSFAYEERVLRAWISLAIGLVFFATAFLMNRDEAELRRSLRWLYAGLVVTILWSLVQALAIHTSLLSHDFIDRIQFAFSDIGLQARRVVGFAYEPAWLSDQMLLFYAPWLLAALLTGYTLFKRSWVEGILLGLCLLVVLLTFSRSGLVIAAIAGAVTLFTVGRAGLGRLWTWFSGPMRRRAFDGALLLRLAIVLAVVLATMAAVRFLASYDYITAAFEIDEDESLVDYLVDISAGPRLAYTLAGYQVFEQAPLTGVGLGGSGLYLFDHFAEWSFTVPEVAKQLAPEANLVPNTKSLYMRLLAETGLPGFWAFAAFLLSLLALLRVMWQSANPTLRYAAVAGLFAWIGFGLRNLTQDSLTLPIMWVIFGMLAGLATTNHQKVDL